MTDGPAIPAEDDLLVAEYVIGVLPHDERVVGESRVHAGLGRAEDRRETACDDREGEHEQRPIEVIREAAIELAHAQSSR